MNRLWPVILLPFVLSAQTTSPRGSTTAGGAMAATVMRDWPAGMVSTIGSKGQWGYEEGVLLDGMADEWHVTSNPAYFDYIKAAVDKYVTADGVITGYKADAHSLDNIEMGRAVMVVYLATHEDRYAKAAKFLREQLAAQPRTPSGGYWHKQIYPNQMWLDGAYMAEPFRAMYADAFGVKEDWDDIAKQLLLMHRNMTDAPTFLIKHGWDESKQMAWADRQTGLSPEVWARAMGWYAVALVDVLDRFPREHPQRIPLEVALSLTMAAVAGVQDSETGLWWQVMDKGSARDVVMGKGEIRVIRQKPAAGNYPEASASCMFVYALAKGARMGYLPQYDLAHAKRGWRGIQKKFVTAGVDGVVLHGTVKVGGLGGTPYRSGSYDYYIHEPVVDQDAKGVGAYLMAASEMERAAQ